MKKLNYLATAAFASVGLLAGSVAANAQVQSPAGANAASTDLIFTAFVNDGGNNSGDIGGTKNLEVDLGTLSSLGSSTTVNLSADLANIYGNPSNAGADAWNSSTRPDTLSWVVYGANTAGTDEFWVTDSSTGIKERGTTQQVNVVNEISPIYSDLDTVTPLGNNGSSDGEVDFSTDTKAFSNEYTTNFDYTNANEFGGGSATQAVSSTLGDAIGFYDAQTHSGTSTLAPEVGTFELDSDGDLTFTSTAAVPEPSTWASLIFGAAGLLAFRRRRLA